MRLNSDYTKENMLQENANCTPINLYLKFVFGQRLDHAAW